MSETISTSVSAAAIFSAEESWGRPPKRKDIVNGINHFFVGALRKTLAGMAISFSIRDQNPALSSLGIKCLGPRVEKPSLYLHSIAAISQTEHGLG